MIDESGTVYEGRGFRVMPIAPTKFFPLDDKSLSIGFIGDHRGIGSKPFLGYRNIFKYHK